MVLIEEDWLYFISQMTSIHYVRRSLPLIFISVMLPNVNYYAFYCCFGLLEVLIERCENQLHFVISPRPSE